MKSVYVDICKSAEADIRALRKSNVKAATEIATTLELIEEDPDAIKKLTRHGDNVFGAARLNVKRWEAAQRTGNLWRFRILDSVATSCRIVYGYHWQTRTICVLAVVKKEDFDYDDLSSDISRRILEDWRAL